MVGIFCELKQVFDQREDSKLNNGLKASKDLRLFN